GRMRDMCPVIRVIGGRFLAPWRGSDHDRSDPMSSQPNGAWLTQDAYDRLTKELEELEGPRRSEIAERIAAARDEGDLKENGGYHAAREQQGMNEARIADLTHLLKNAVVGEAPKDDGVVEQGMVVTITMAGKERTSLPGAAGPHCRCWSHRGRARAAKWARALRSMPSSGLGSRPTTCSSVALTKAISGMANSAPGMPAIMAPPATPRNTPSGWIS